MNALKKAMIAGILVGAGIATDALLPREAAAVVQRRGAGGVGRPGVGPGGVGGPGAPVAGVARRTTRRIIRRTSIYVATLQPGCSTVDVDGTPLHQCGDAYYAQSGNQYEVVNVE